MPAVLARLVILLTLLSGAAQAQQAQFPIKDDDGAPMANHALRPDQMAEIAHLPGLVDVGRILPQQWIDEGACDGMQALYALPAL